MKVKLQDIVDALYLDVDSAVVDDFYAKAKYKEPTEEYGVSNITDKLGFIDTNNAEFQLFLRDFMEIYDNDYQLDLIKNVLEPYYDHSYDLEGELEESAEIDFYTDDAKKVYTYVQEEMNDETRKEIYKFNCGEFVQDDEMNEFWDWFESLDSDELEDIGYDLHILGEEEFEADQELDWKKTQEIIDAKKEEELLGASEEVIADSKAKGLYTEDYKENVKDEISTGLSDDKALDVLNAVIGQLSDGIWENSRGMEKYWAYADIERKGSDIVIKVDRNNWQSAYRGKSDDEIKRYFATKIKQIVKEEGLNWDRNNTEASSYLDYHAGVTVQDAYRVYDKLLGRKDRIELQEGYKETLEKELERIQEIIANADPGKDISGIEEKRDYLMDKLNQLED